MRWPNDALVTWWADSARKRVVADHVRKADPKGEVNCHQ